MEFQIPETISNMRAGLVGDPPQAYECVFNANGDRKSCPKVGSNVEIFETLAALLNWNITYQRAFSYGSAGLNKAISGGGLAGALQRKQYDVSATLMSINPSSMPYLDYSYPVTYLRFGLLAHPPQPKDISLLIIKPFHLSVWIVIGISLILFYLFIKLADRFRLGDFSRLLEQGHIAWLVFFVCASYSSLIKACLLRPKEEIPFKNLDQLLKHTLEHNGSYFLLSEFNYWTMTKDDWIASGTLGSLGREARRLGFVTVNHNVSRLLEIFATDRRYVLWGDESRVHRGMVEIPGSVALFDDEFTQYWLAFAFPKKSNWTSKVNNFIPLLFDYASRMMSRYAERWALTMMPRHAKIAHKLLPQDEDERKFPVDKIKVALSLGVLQGAFVIFLSGIGVSILVLCLEKWFHTGLGNDIRIALINASYTAMSLLAGY